MILTLKVEPGLLYKGLLCQPGTVPNMTHVLIVKTAKATNVVIRLDIN